MRDDEYEARLAAREAELATICVHAGDPHGADAAYRALSTPIVLASAFSFDDAEHAAGAFTGENDAYIYGRWGNPTVEALEAKLAALENATAACATASGMAAISGTLLSICESGAHVIAPRSMYGESARLLRERLPRLGIATTFLDDVSPEAYARAATPQTRVFYIESPSNPILAVADVAGIASAARAHGAKSIADNTFATPFCQTPLDLGVDLVVHSMTKALGGHGDAIGGAVCGKNADDVERARDAIVKGFGGVMSPLTAYLVARGMVTFALRQRRACSTAARLAKTLASHARVTRVHHPSLSNDAKHMHAFGSLLSFELATLDDARGVLERVSRNSTTITHAVSLGDARTLVTHPAATTHSTMPREDRARAHITDGLLRLSVGLESASDLERDLLAALGDRP